MVFVGSLVRWFVGSLVRWFVTDFTSLCRFDVSSFRCSMVCWDVDLVLCCGGPLRCCFGAPWLLFRSLLRRMVRCVSALLCRCEFVRFVR